MPIVHAYAHLLSGSVCGALIKDWFHWGEAVGDRVSLANLT
jgi:hypothetical protein